MRPKSGAYRFYVSLKGEEWSPWLLYAAWGAKGQAGGEGETADVRVYQDIVEMKGGKEATGFRVKVETDGEADVTEIKSMHVYTNSPTPHLLRYYLADATYINLPVKGLSQMDLGPLGPRLCSPTSTTGVVRFLSGKETIDPLSFAEAVWDSRFDIYGNWVFNVAQASAELGSAWSVWVERLHHFDAIYLRLEQGTPVVVSVRGPLPGSALPYEKGHLIAVIGYDPEGQKVICMDPAFPADNQTWVRYDLDDFVAAWNRRGCVAYVFEALDRS